MPEFATAWSLRFATQAAFISNTHVAHATSGYHSSATAVASVERVTVTADVFLMYTTVKRPVRTFCDVVIPVTLREDIKLNYKIRRYSRRSACSS